LDWFREEILYYGSLHYWNFTETTRKMFIKDDVLMFILDKIYPLKNKSQSYGENRNKYLFSLSKVSWNQLSNGFIFTFSDYEVTK